MDMKLVVLVRQDLKLPKGKLAAQVAHAAVEATLNTLKSNKAKVSAWRKEGQKKIVLKVPDEKALLKHLQEAKDSGLKTALITDAGKTCIAPGTRTCLGIGPDSKEDIDAITGELPMM